MKNKSKISYKHIFIVAIIAITSSVLLFFLNSPDNNNCHSFQETIALQGAKLIENSKTIRKYENRIASYQAVIDSLDSAALKLQHLSDSIHNVVSYYSLLITELQNSFNDEPNIIDIDDHGQLELFLNWTNQ